MSAEADGSYVYHLVFGGSIFRGPVMSAYVGDSDACLVSLCYLEHSPCLDK